MQSEQVAGLGQRSHPEPKSCFLPPLIAPHTSHHQIINFSNLISFQALWLKRRRWGRGHRPIKQRLQCLRNGERPSIVQADTIYNPFNVHTPEGAGYGEQSTSAKSLASQRWGSQAARRPTTEGKNELLLLLFYNIQHHVTEIKRFLFLTHLWQQSASLLWALSLSYWKNWKGGGGRGVGKYPTIRLKGKKVVENTI